MFLLRNLENAQSLVPFTVPQLTRSALRQSQQPKSDYTQHVNKPRE